MYIELVIGYIYIYILYMLDIHVWFSGLDFVLWAWYVVNFVTGS